jgi:Na+/H+ antiporter NhaD/arsenite permease-like protein
MDFIIHLAPAVVIIMIFYLLAIRLIWGKKLRTRDELKRRIMEMDEREAIKDPVMLKKSLFVLAVVIAGFVFHGALHYEPATVALFGAALLLLLSNTDEPHHVLAEVEWPTIFFFMGLFIIIGGVVKVGLIKWMSVQVLNVTQGDLFATSMIVMWFSAFASAIIDNIPYVATMNPLVIDVAKQLWPNETGVQLLQHPALMPVWWSLALGACLGGNGSAIGASANVIVVGLSEKMGKRISFVKFMLYGMPIMILTVVISTIYIWVRYYVL